ncbi:hypothetical protein M3Y94_01242100 [Aphelenchoides besseyi]|nr:hypothetical protein M3Y94_01242100 [Aphelenchoides besseyi]
MSAQYRGTGANSTPLQAPYGNQTVRQPSAPNAAYANYVSGYSSFVSGSSYQADVTPVVQPTNGGDPAVAAAQALASNTNEYLKGYEHAIIEHARQMQLQQARNQLHNIPVGGSTETVQPMISRLNTVGGWKTKKKKGNADTRPFYCELCNVSCIGQQPYEAHIVGKAHKRKEDIKNGKIKVDSSLAQFKCEACNVTCCTKEAFATHINGIKHSRAINNMQAMGKIVPPALLIEPEGDPLTNLPVMKKIVGVTATKFVGGVKLSTTGDEQGQIEIIPEDVNRGFQPVGEEFLEPIVGGKKVAFWCKLCECQCGDQTSRDLHVRGRRHRISYRDKVDPTMEIKDAGVLTRGGAMRSSNPVSRQPPSHGIYYNNVNTVASNHSLKAKICQPMSFRQPPMSSSIMPETSQYDAYDEQHVFQRLDQLKPESEQEERTESLVFLVERTLKKLSEIHVDPKDPEGTRQLRGVVRVGALANGLLCKFDKKVHVVLTCKEVPTIKLLQETVDSFLNYVDDDEIRPKVVVEMHIEDSEFTVRYNDFDVVCHVTLTSVALRNVEDPTNSTKKVALPLDVLPEMPCLRALADLRHTRYYQSQCAPLHAVSEVVTLLRDIVDRIETWKAVPLYTLQLLVYKAVISVPLKLSVSNAFRRVFEMIASGVFMSKKFTELIDPCEKEPTNPLFDLTVQQRENFICSAQHALRLIAFDQIHMVLGMERWTNTRKRQHSNENEVEESAKKVKSEESVDQNEPHDRNDN